MYGMAAANAMAIVNKRRCTIPARRGAHGGAETRHAVLPSVAWRRFARAACVGQRGPAGGGLEGRTGCVRPEAGVRLRALGPHQLFPVGAMQGRQTGHDALDGRFLVGLAEGPMRARPEPRVHEPLKRSAASTFHNPSSTSTPTALSTVAGRRSVQASSCQSPSVAERVHAGAQPLVDRGGLVHRCPSPWAATMGKHRPGALVGFHGERRSPGDLRAMHRRAQGDASHRHPAPGLERAGSSNATKCAFHHRAGRSA